MNSVYFLNIVLYPGLVSVTEQRRARHRERVRKEILDAAGELFAVEGYDHVSMRRIGDKIGYSPATIYLYFQDKEDLLRQLCDETFRELIETIHAEKSQAADPLDGLRRGSRAYIRFGLEHPNAYIVTFVRPPEGKDGDPEFEQTVGAQCFEGLTGAIQACIDAGQVSAEIDVLRTATYWWGSLHGLTSLLIAHKSFPWVAPDELIESLLSHLIRGLEK